MLAKEEEKDIIKNSKKEYNLRCKNVRTEIKNKNNNISYFLGDVIQSKQYNKEKFLIVRKGEMNKRAFGCISLNKLKDGILEPVLIVGKKNILDSILNLQKKCVKNLRDNNIYSLSNN